MGEAPDRTMRSVARAISADLPLAEDLVFQKGDVLVLQKRRSGTTADQERYAGVVADAAQAKICHGRYGLQ